MNRVGHHNIILKFTSNNKIVEKGKILMDASDFTDSVTHYFYYNYNYKMRVNGNDNVITLERVVSENCQYLLNIQPLAYSYPQNYKDIFAAINGRDKSTIVDEFLGNQDDNVSFLHAMGAKNEDKEMMSKKIFKLHLERCFSEYLFLKDDDEALFMLGIAFHGIMDSFTSSHTDFQKYSEQNMAFHAQGDVIPIEGIDTELFFDPGQIGNDKTPGGEWFAGVFFKGFDKDNILNPFENVMLLLYLYLGNIRSKVDKRTLSYNDIEVLVEKLSMKTIKEINNFLKENYEYGDDAYIFSRYAIESLTEIWNELSSLREKSKDYAHFKDVVRVEKEVREDKDIAVSKVKEVVEKWEKKYNIFIEKLSEDNKLDRLKALFCKWNSKAQFLQGVGGNIYSNIEYIPQTAMQIGREVGGSISSTLENLPPDFFNGSKV